MKKSWLNNEPRLALIFLVSVITIAVGIVVFSPKEVKADNMTYYEKQHIELLREQNRSLERIASSLQAIERKMK